jgi:hypothetical protein
VERARCVVIVPYLRYIEPACDEALRGLEALGYPVRRIEGSAAIDRLRSQLATQALADGYQEIMWIDSDTSFEPDAIDRLRAHGFPLVGGVYAMRTARQLACRFLPDTAEVTLGEGGTPLEVRYTGTGFLLTHRRVYEDIARKFDLPLCNARFGVPAVPYFLPMVLADAELGFWYLSEDWSFCERARQAGHEVWVDPSVRLWHLGTYGYGWEDVVAPVARRPMGKLRFPK